MPDRLRVRPAVDGDCRAVYDIAMQPSVRERSTRSGHFTFAQHQEWWQHRLCEATTRIWVGETDAVVGYVRYGSGPPAEPGEAEIAVAVDEGWRGIGIARALIQRTRWRALRALGVDQIKALIVKGNDVSIALFRSCGFHQDGAEDRMGKQHSVWGWP